MRPAEFSEQATGQLVPIPGGWAFVPRRLPPDLAASWRLTSLLDEATTSLARLAGQALLVANRSLLIRPVRTREAVDSNEIEGTHTHIYDVLLHQEAGPPRDARQVTNQMEVLRYLETTALGE